MKLQLVICDKILHKKECRLSVESFDKSIEALAHDRRSNGLNVRQDNPGFFSLRLTIVLIVFFIGRIQTVGAQDLLNLSNLSAINSDNVSDADLLKFKTQVESTGKTLDEIGQMIMQKGMPAGEWAKLKSRIERMSRTARTPDPPTILTEGYTQTVSRQVQPNDYQRTGKQVDSSVFGSSFFSTAALSFEPNLRIATPANYILGPDDELIIVVSGQQEMSIRLRVQPEGAINIPQVGFVNVSGLKIEDATKRIREKMTQTVYKSLLDGSSRINVSLGDIRSIRITIIGAAKPGNYTVPSLSTIFNSLYISGGPGIINSYREIELRRSGKVIRKVDIYQLLAKGDESGNILLQDGDVINIPVYKKRVKVSGEVKRSGIFEMLDGETMDDLIFFAGGFTENAYSSTITVRQVTDKERRIKDLSKADFTRYIPANGDAVVVGKVLDRFENRGFYQWSCEQTWRIRIDGWSDSSGADSKGRRAAGRCVS